MPSSLTKTPKLLLGIVLAVLAFMVWGCYMLDISLMELIESFPSFIGFFVTNFFPPDFSKLAEFIPSILDTFFFAIVATYISATFATLFGLMMSEMVNPFKPLRDIGVCVADIPSASSIDAMLEDTRFIAACVGAQETCEELIAQFQKELDQLSDIGASIQDKKRVVVELACAPDIYTAGSGTFMNEMLAMIGAENIFGDQEGYLAVTEEAVITLNPDVILTMVDYVEDPVAEIMGRTGWEHVAAVVNGDVYLVNTNAVSLPNLHVIDGIKQMAKMIYPDAYAGIEDPFASGEAA